SRRDSSRFCGNQRARFCRYPTTRSRSPERRASSKRARRKPPMTESTLVLGQLFNGISVASILLLAALGLALSFGLMRVINMSHGEMLMMGGYLTYISVSMFGKSVGFALGLVVAFI